MGLRFSNSKLLILISQVATIHNLQYLLVKDLYFSDKVKEINKQTHMFILKKYVISINQKIAVLDFFFFF